MKILVGVMHCIENEFYQCLEAINNQTLPAFEHFIISQLPNKVAHDKLYQTFMNKAKDVDLFIKVDADMVISRPTFFQECADKFNRDVGLEHLQIALDDWMTKRRIFGLHVYRSTHKWQRISESIFVDMVDQPHQVTNDTSDLAPAAIHCPDPSPFQAYHYGLHKGVKFVQKDRPKKHLPWQVIHWNHFENLERQFFLERERRHGLAVLGFHDAIINRWGPTEVDFNSEQPLKRFTKLNALSNSELFKLARMHALPGMVLLPHHFRFELSRLYASRDYTLRSLAEMTNRLLRNAYRRECPEVSRTEVI